jgi:glycosyltransferase involved in cell wall biosynthesis
MAIKLARLTTTAISMQLLLRGQESYFTTKGFEMFLASGPGDRFTETGMAITLLPFNREFSIWKDVYAFWKTWKWLKHIQPDILHTHTPKAGIIGIVAGYFAGVRIRIHTVGGLPEMELQGIRKLILRWTEQVTGLFATRIYPNSHGLLQYMAQKRLAPLYKMKIIGAGSSNGIDLDYFKPTPLLFEAATLLSKRYGILDTDFVFVFIGRLDNHKGLRELKTAFERILKIYPTCWLLLVGPLETAREGLDSDTLDWFQLQDRVIMPGFQKDVRPWLLASKVLVFPSYREGFPNVPLQACAMGIPVIASDIIGCSEIVIDKRNGWLIPKKDPEALEKAMIYFLDNPRERIEMGKCGRAEVASRFEQQLFWTELEKEYHSLLKATELAL